MKGWLVGQTLPAFARNAASERTVNLFLESLGPTGKAPQVLIGTPGLRSFGTLSQGPGRGIYEINGRVFAVGGERLHEVFANGTVTTIGEVKSSGDPAIMASNGNRGFQLFVASGGPGYVYNLSTGAFAEIHDEQFPIGVKYVGYLDGYFLVVTSDRFGISALLDGVTWGADQGQRVGASEDIIGAIIDHEVLWLMGNKATEVWFDSGNASFPFEPIPGVFLETGLAATHAITRAGDSILWLSQDERGARQIMRNQGYDAVAVSTPGTDAMLSALPSVADARMWSFQILGHLFAVLSIPNQKVTLLYDTKENAFSEWLYWNSTTGQYEAHRASCHCYAFGKHLVLDRETAAVHELTMDAHDDAGEARRWLRRTQHLTKDHKMLVHHSLELEAEMGVGLLAGGSPEVRMTYSDDGGMTWGNERTATLGAHGRYDNRASWHMLGASRNRVYEFSGTDAVKTVLIDGYLNVSEGRH